MRRLVGPAASASNASPVTKGIRLPSSGLPSQRIRQLSVPLNMPTHQSFLAAAGIIPLASTNLYTLGSSGRYPSRGGRGAFRSRPNIAYVETVKCYMRALTAERFEIKSTNLRRGGSLGAVFD